MDAVCFFHPLAIKLKIQVVDLWRVVVREVSFYWLVKKTFRVEGSKVIDKMLERV